jgi:hypothetical protein
MSWWLRLWCANCVGQADVDPTKCALGAESQLLMTDGDVPMLFASRSEAEDYLSRVKLFVPSCRGVVEEVA